MLKRASANILQALRFLNSTLKYKPAVICSAREPATNFHIRTSHTKSLRGNTSGGSFSLLSVSRLRLVNETMVMSRRPTILDSGTKGSPQDPRKATDADSPLSWQPLSRSLEGSAHEPSGEPPPFRPLYILRSGDLRASTRDGIPGSWRYCSCAARPNDRARDGEVRRTSGPGPDDRHADDDGSRGPVPAGRRQNACRSHRCRNSFPPLTPRLHECGTGLRQASSTLAVTPRGHLKVCVFLKWDPTQVSHSHLRVFSDLPGRRSDLRTCRTHK